MESGAAPMLAQRCNFCWQEATGSCFRTKCGHLFCESCAFQHFAQSQTCPACGIVLEEADISDLTIGLAPAHFRRMLFQEIYKDPDYRSVGQSVVRTSMALYESVAFVLAQLTLEGQRSAESDVLLKEELTKQRQENGRLTMQLRTQSAAVEEKLREADHTLRLRQKELADLQEAYKEKSRKCQAWEKSYTHLRAQAERGGGRSAGFTPPESPRVGAVRGPTSYAALDGMRGAMASAAGASQHRVGGGSGGGGGSIQRSDVRGGNSPRSNLRGGTFLGRADHVANGGAGGGNNGSGSSWAMQRPNTARGPSMDHHVSPMLRPRQQGYSHSVTPSPTFPGQESTRFAPKRPETPLVVRGYYSRDPSPTNRTSGGGGGGGMGGGRSRGSFFPPNTF